MDLEKKRRIAHEVLILLGMLALLTFVTRLWPILLLVMLGILICALRLLFIKVKTAEVIAPAALPPEPPMPETELTIIRRAFGLLQQRITEQVEQQYPGARWVWGVSNATLRFKNGEPLIVLLNGAGGYGKAQVLVHNLIFKGLYYRTLETETVPPEASEDADEINSPDDADDDADTDADSPEGGLSEDAPIIYERLAFEWVDANMVDLSAKYNEAIAQNKAEMLIPSEDLPHPDSLPDVCEELKRNGFTIADFSEGGIIVNITH